MHVLWLSSSSQHQPGTSSPFQPLTHIFPAWCPHFLAGCPSAGFGAFCLGNRVSLLNLVVLQVPGGQLPVLE